MNVTTIAKIAALYYLIKKRKELSERRRPQRRKPPSRSFATLYARLRQDEGEFFDYCQMSTASFDALLAKLKKKLTHASLRRAPIPPVERLMVTLRFLATGQPFTELHRSFRIGISTIGCIVNEVCSAIWQELREERPPEKTENIERAFDVMANKFKIFHSPLRVNTNTAENIVKACCVLHNFIDDDDKNANDLITNAHRSWNALRYAFENCFVSRSVSNMGISNSTPRL